MSAGNYFYHSCPRKDNLVKIKVRKYTLILMICIDTYVALVDDCKYGALLYWGKEEDWKELKRGVRNDDV